MFARDRKSTSAHLFLTLILVVGLFDAAPARASVDAEEQKAIQDSSVYSNPDGNSPTRFDPNILGLEPSRAPTSSASSSNFLDDGCDPESGQMWINGPLLTDVAGQAQAELSQQGINASVEARGYGELDGCGTYTHRGVDFMVTLPGLKANDSASVRSLQDAILPVLTEYGKPSLGNVKFVASGGAVVPVDPYGDALAASTLDAGPPAEDAITKKVYVVVYDPVLSNGQSLSGYLGWNNYSSLAQQTVDFFKQTSNDKMIFTIVDTTIVTDRWPELVDGFSYTEQEYLAVWANPSLHHIPTEVDYEKFVSVPEFDICGKVNRGEIDEVWVYSGPWFGFYESRLVGLSGYKFNSNPILGTACAKMVPIMGPSMERTIAESVENFGHRMEATMERTYGSWQQNRTAHNWDKFALVKAQSPDYSYSGCGTIHYPPNGTTDYDYGNTTPVLSNCADFLNYPTLGDPLVVSQPVTCSAWGCLGVDYLRYWFSHLPDGPGCGIDDVANDWWKYFADPSLALIPLLACSPPPVCPTITAWQGEYWNNRGLLGQFAVCRDVPNINFDMGGGSPDPLIYGDNYSTRWTRTLHFNGGTYRFYMMNDNGARLYVDGVLQLDAWDSCCSWKQVDVPLTAGDHIVRMEMFEYDGGSAAKLWWEILGPYSTEIDLRGNGVSIADGDTTPSLADHTDFNTAIVLGTTVSRTFTVHNVGESTLNLTGTPKVAISGANASDFAVTAEPANQITAAGSTTFTITFTPGAAGLRTAIVSIPTNDLDENPFNFSIQGTGIEYPHVLSITRANPDPTNASSVGFTVNFSESVTGVDSADFHVTMTGGVSGASISAVSGSGSSYLVTANTGSGNGTIRLDLTDDNSIRNPVNTPLGGPTAGDGNFTSGESYTIDKTSCYTLTVAAAPAAGGSVNASAQNCTGGYIGGTVVQLAAVPNSGYAFTNWSGDASGRSNPTSITMTGNKNVTANFIQLTDGLVAYWRFDEGTGVTAFDSSPNGNNGAVNGATWAAGKVAGGLRFDGVNDQVQVPNNASLSLSTNRVTFAGWVYLTSVSNGWLTVIQRSNTNASWYDWQFYARAADAPTPNHPVFRIDWNKNGVTDANEQVQGDIALQANTWYFLTVTYDGTALKFYIDGTLRGTTNVSGGVIPASNRAIWLGGNDAWGEYFPGTIDEFRIYNRALNQTEIQSLMSQTAYSVGLLPGWNMVSFNVHPLSTDVASVLAGIAGSYDLVYAWDATGAHAVSGNWLKADNIPASPDTLANIDETMGFWVHMTAADTLTVTGSVPASSNISLLDNAGGWNLVAYPSAVTRALPGALTDHGIGTNFSLVYAYHPEDVGDPWKLYDYSVPPFVNDLTQLVPGFGYWIKVNADRVWIVDYAAP